MSGKAGAPAHWAKQWWSLAVVVAIHAATCLLMPARGLWMVDNENRFLQIESLADSGLQRYAIPWAGKDIDPAFALNPLRFNPEGTFSATRDGELISVFQPPFLLLGAVVLKTTGITGLNLLPVLGAALMLAGVAALAGRVGAAGKARHLAVLLAGLATPAWFYSLNLWEHTLAAALVTWGVVGLLDFARDRSRRPLVLGAAALAGAVLLRDVTGLFALILFGVLAARVADGRARLLATGGAVLAVGVALLVVIQALVIDKPLGFHAGTLAGGGGLGDHLARRPAILFLYLVAAHPERWLSFALAAPYLAAFALRPRLAPQRAAVVVPVFALAVAVAAAAWLAGLATAANPLRHLLGANSFFVAAPVLVFALLRVGAPGAASRDRRPADDARDIVLAAACLYLLAYCLVAPWAGAVSLHWGGRLQFCIYPLLAALAARTLGDWFALPGRRPRAALAAVAAVMLVSVAAQAWSVGLVRDKKLHAARVAQALERLEPRVVITDVWWAGHEMYEVFADRTIFYVRSQEQINDLVERLHARGTRQFVFATRPRPGPAAPGVIRVDDAGWGFYSLDLLVSPIGPGPGSR